MITQTPCSPRERMIRAYRGQWSDVRPVAPEFWCFVPARVMGVDMVTFEREVPHWQALRETFRQYQTEGWGIVCPSMPNPNIEVHATFKRVGEGQFEEKAVTRTPHGVLTSARRFDTSQPSWVVERPVKRLDQDLEAWLDCAFSPLDLSDFSGVNAALTEVGEDYLLEVMVGGMFFDFLAGPMGMEQGILALADHDGLCRRLQERFIERSVEATRLACERTADAPLFIGCAWSCASLIGPRLWRHWDKPGVTAIAREAHRHGRLVHLHYHGRCMENLSDIVDTGVDCVCPFERPPGGDVADLMAVRDALAGRVTFNGNVHTVESLIRGAPEAVRREVLEIAEAFDGSPRLIIGTGDQVGGETPDENIHAMIETCRSLPV